MKTFDATVYYVCLPSGRRKNQILSGIVANDQQEASRKAREMYEQDRERRRSWRSFIDTTITKVVATEYPPAQAAAPAPAPLAETHRAPGFLIGDRVVKLKGYAFDGIIVSAFNTVAGVRRYVVESTIIPGMLHIFSGTQLAMAG